MEIIKVIDLPHVCRIDKGAEGHITNCGNEYIPDYGFFFFNYANKDHENYHTVKMQYQFKFYEIKIHRCYNFGPYCELRNNLDNILKNYFKYKQDNDYSCVRDPAGFVDFEGVNCHGELFSTQNYKRLFDIGFHEYIGYGYYVRWRLSELLKFDFSNYKSPKEWVGNEYLERIFNMNKWNLELIFGCKLSEIEKNKLKLSSALLKERVKKQYAHE